MIANMALYLVAVALLPCFTVSYNGFSRRQTTHMSVESCNSEKSIAEFSKFDLNRVLVATASAMSVFAISSSANAYGAVSDQVKTKKTAKSAPKVLETELGIKYIELKKGSGAFPTANDYVIINYSGFLSNGTAFDTTEQKGRKPLSFRLGKKQVIPGIESVLEYMQPGGEVTCTIPAKYAYGEKGICIEGEGCIVQPNETLNYVIKLVNVGAGYS